jgi:protocatechuate 3,4-dioxygenase beta subunit
VRATGEQGSGGWGGPILMMIVAVLALAGAMLGARHVVVEHGFAGEGPDAPGRTDRSSDELHAGERVRIRGRILLEVPDEDASHEGEHLEEGAETDGPDEVETGPSDEDDEVETGPVDDEGRDGPRPAVELVPPEEGACRVVVWQEGVRLAPPVTCDHEGEFEVELPAVAAGAASVELSVPDRLRAVIQTELPEQGIGRLPTVALGLAQRVGGLVVDGRGEPVADAEIQAMPLPNLGEPEPWRATTDETGRFAFDTLPPGPVGMRASKAGHAVAVVEAIAPQDDVLVVLEALIDLRGEVVGPPELVARAKVRLEGSGIWPARTVSVDARGGFEFPGITDGVYALEAVVESEDGAPGEPEYASVPLENVSPDLHVSLALTRAHRVPVRVVEPGGTAVADARVTVGNSQVGLLQRVAQTDAEGRASIGPLVPGPYVVRADADGWLPSDPIALSLSEAPLDEQELVLARPARISGVVVDEHDRPVEGATVLVRSDALYTLGEGRARARVFEQTLMAIGTLGVTKGPVPEIPAFDDAVPSSLASPTTGSDGRFGIGSLAPGIYRVQAVHGRYARSAEVEVRLGPGHIRGDLRLVLRTGQPLTGRVLDGNRRPIEGARIELDDGSTFMSDLRGLFDAGHRRGHQSLVVRAAGKVARRLDVRMLAAPVDVEIVLPDAEGGLELRALDGNDRPIDGARVLVQMLDELTPTIVGFTDTRGVFEIDGLPTGPAEIEIHHADHVPSTLRVDVSRRRVGELLELVLRTGWSLEVEVVEQGTRRPISGASVQADGMQVRTDAQGRARLRGLSVARVRVEVEADGRSSRSVSVVRPAGEHADLRVELVDGGNVEGRVIDYRGDPVPGAEVVVRAAQTGEVLAEVRTGQAGRWAIDGLPEGDIVVEAFPPIGRDDLAEVAQRSDVLRGRTTRGVDLRLERR